MDEFILLSDTHLGRNKCRNIDIDVTEKLFDRVIEKAIERNIKYLIFAGDFFEKWEGINLKLLPTTYKIANQLSQTFEKIYFLIGNHDIYYKNSLYPTSLMIFSQFSNIEIIDEITQVNDYTLVPWIISSQIEQFKENLHNNIFTSNLIGHLEMNGIVINRSGTVSSYYSLNQKDFEKFDRVLSGHFHQPGIYGNIQYIGSPYHTNFNDSGKRGFYIINKEIEFIEFTEAPKYVIYSSEDNIKEEDIKGNHVRIDFYQNLGTEKIEKRIQEVKEMEPLSIKPKYLFTEEFIQSQSEEEIQLNTNLDIIKDYIDKSEPPENINKEILKGLAESIYKETQGEN